MTLSNLVEDVNKVLENSVEPSKKDVEDFLRDVGDVISKSFKPRESKDGLRFSNIGKPNRMLWYKHNMPEKAEHLHGATLIKFMYGDILEALLVLLIKTAGYKVTDQQKRVEVDGIVGHTDGRINGRLVDYKSASPYSFGKFQSGKIFSDDPFGYLAQISGYAHDKKEDASWVVLNKVDGHITVCDVDNLEMINFKERVAEAKEVVSKATPPERCYSDKPEGLSGNRVLDISCQYCDYKKECWKDANNGKGLRKFAYAYGPRFFTELKKNPPKGIEELEV